MKDLYSKHLGRRQTLQMAIGAGLKHFVALRAPGLVAATASGGQAGAESQLSPARRRIGLDGVWNLTYGPLTNLDRDPTDLSQPPTGWQTIPATVPGNVELDMVAAGRLQDPTIGSRVYSLQKLEHYQWWYRRTFASPHLRPGERAELVFDGIDCLGTVWLNGKLAGRAANMLISHRFDVTALLRTNAANELVVRIDPAVPAGRRVSHPPGEYDQLPGNWESLPIRKAPHMYGWDIMPRVISAGLWRGVSLEVTKPTHWRDVYWTTTNVNAAAQRASICLDWEFLTDVAEIDSLRMEIVLRRAGQVAYRSEQPVLTTRGQRTIQLRNPSLWWPRGYGEQPLYEAILSLRNASGDVLDEHRTMIGVRTVALQHSEIVSSESPGDFAFLVNGTKIFVKGANWTPLDGFHSRDLAELDEVFAMVTDLNCNMLRCWGGGVYESDRFFDLCDQAGVLVWQDFALACALYPQTQEFLEQMRVEAEAVIVRLRNHPSLALWAGGNEDDEVYGWAGMGFKDPNGDRISRGVLPAAVEQFDPYRAYLPSSPYRSPALIAHGNDSNLMPEVHLWGPRGYYKAPYYTEVAAHFVSEIGYHGCPSKASLGQMFDRDSVFPWTKEHVWNDEWLTKSVRFHPLANNTAGRNDLMIRQIRALFGEVPDGLDNFILASQITQAEAMKFFVEFWRMGKGKRNGILWWNVRDGWPILSDSVVDHYNRKKLAYVYLKSVQRDVQAMCSEPKEGVHRIVVVNDTLRPVNGRVLVRRAGERTALLDAKFEIGINGLTEAGTIPQPKEAGMWQLEWSVEGGARYQSHYLNGKAPMSFDTYCRWMKQLGIEPA